MMRFRSSLLPVLVVISLAFSARAQAQEPIRFGRTPDISPDGKLVAFSYLGDVWIVEAIGGVARPVTMHEKHDMMPVFSPDGRKLAFSSNRHGSYDVFVVSIQGGRPTRLTFDSADDFVTGWSPDGKYILFSSSRSTSFPFSYELFKVPVSGGRVERISIMDGREGVYSPSGDEIAYVRGPGAWYRKGYRGSSNDDIWICNADGHNNRQLTSFNGQDNSPMWCADGRTLCYVSETFGTPANIVRQEIASPKGAPLTVKSPPQQLTFHKEDGVRRARISASGEWIVYECGADLWVVSARGGTTRKLAIEVHADDKVNPERTVTFTSGASEFAPSYDERHIAFAVHGSLFLMPRSGGKATRLTEGPHYDHSIAWAPDSQKIAFLSDRGGQDDVWLLESDDPEHRALDKAHKFKVKQLTSTPEAESGLNFSPDGKRISFLRAGKLVTMNPDGSDVKVVVDQGTVIDYEWSPDSKRLCYARMDGSFASELYIIPATGATAAEPARNVTRYATFNAGVTWSRTGGKLAFISERRGQSQSLFVLSLQKPAIAGTTPPAAEIDWEDIHLRAQQPTPMTVMEGAISNDGSKVAFRSLQNGDDLWVASSDGRDVTRITTGNQRPTQIQWSRTMSSLVYFKDGNGQIHMVSASSAANLPAVPFKAKMTVRRDEEFAEMFEQSWRALRDNFYDANFHGANWNAIRDKYRPLVTHVALKEDLYHLIYLMLGELNASHLGIRGMLGAAEETTADLGLILDDSYRGPGLRIAEVLKRGPADRRGINLKPGDFILSIDRTALTERTNISELLNGKVGEAVELEVVTPAAGSAVPPADPKSRRRVEIQGTNRTQISALMYDRWVENNAQVVAKLSDGKLGYIHIPSMDNDGLDRFVRALYSDNFDKEAIVLDVRYNGGGFTHDRVLNYLGGKEHTFFHQRNGGQGLVLRAGDRKWTKPLVLLINNRSYSDAEIFPNAFRTLGLGKLVGQPTGAHVIGTMQVRLIDGSEFRLPRTGVFTVRGVNMEKEGVTPDFVVEQPPDELARGIDPQLVKAVDVLKADVIAWKQARSGVAANPADAAAPTPVLQPAPPAVPMPAPNPGPAAKPASSAGPR
jgi:tricorn protease